VTSLPELVTGLSAVTLAKAPDMAVGDVLGSCLFNLAILAAVDVAHRKGPLYSAIDPGHLLSASFGVVLLATAALVLLLDAQGRLPSLGHVSSGSAALLALYVLALRAIYLAEQRQRPQRRAEGPTMPLKAAISGYALAATVILACGVALPLIGVELAARMGWSHSLIGTLFIAMATSVPELATTLGALRIGALDMAVANLLGSNLFNLTILALDDLAWVSGSLYANVAPVHAVSALTACIMSGAVVVALAVRPAARVRHIGSWVSVVLLVLYLFNAMLQFQHAG
jgi:cation:H+ antiporter